MIATTTKNGKSVRLSADYHLDIEQVYYTVYCEGYTFEFPTFKLAARTYKVLSARIEAGEMFDLLLKNLVYAAKAMGYVVREAVA